LPALVIGAGITGLTVAYELWRRGVTPVVIERAERAGGLVHTEHADGFTIEAGADSLLAQKPAALELCEQLGLGAQLQEVRPPRRAFVLKGRTLHPLPHPSVLGLPLTWNGLLHYDLLSPAARARLALEPLIRTRSTAPDESVGAFFRRRFGGETVDLIAQPLLGGIHAGDIEQLSMQALFPRLFDAERTDGSVLTGLKRSQAIASAAPAAAGQPPTPTRAAGFVSLKTGMGALIDALLKALPPGAVRYGQTATRLTWDDGRWTVTTPIGSLTAPLVIIAAPASAAATLLQEIDPDAAHLCRQVPYVSTAAIALAWPKRTVAHALSGTGFVVARRHSDVRITACTWVSSKWEGRAPAETVLLRAFIGGAHDPDAINLSDEELVAVAQADLAPLLGITGDPLLTRVYRWPDAGAQHIVGHEDRIRRLQQRLAGHHELLVAGSGFHAVGIPDCVRDARAAAESAAAFAAEKTDGGRGTLR